MKNSAILLLSCSDQKGIIANISDFIFKNGGNILNSDQCSDPITNTFFMRLEWDLENFKISRSAISARFEEVIARKFNMNFSINFSSDRKNIAIFVSKYNHCLIDLILRKEMDEINGNIKFIVSNHLDLEYVAKLHNLEFFYFPITKENKKEQEKMELELLKKYEIELVVLARYMQVLSMEFLTEFKHSIINIHHSFLPAFMGANPYHQAFERGVKLIGATSHYASNLLDDGPIISQDVIHIKHNDSESDLVQKGRDLEKSVLSKAVKLHLSNKILVHNNKTIVF